MANKKHEPMASIIQYDGGDHILIWKHHIEDFNFGSQLIVHDGQEAIFFRNGRALNTFGPGRHSLVTNQLPLLEKFYKLPAETEAVLQSEVYFINTTTQLGLKWGTDSKVRVFDPGTGLHLELGASGEFSIRITNPRKLLLKVIGAGTQLSREDILGMETGTGMFRGMVMTHVKNYLAQVIRDEQISILEIDTRLLDLSAALRERINKELDVYGLEMPEFYVSRILLPENDPNFQAVRALCADTYLKVRTQEVLALEAEASKQHKLINALANQKRLLIEADTVAQQKIIQAKADAEALRLRSEAEVEDMKRKDYNYQQETARKVGMEAMKNGLAGGDGSCGGSGLGDLATLGVGLGAVGSIAGLTKNVIGPAFSSDDDDDDRWNCACGQANLIGNFCPACGTRRPAPGRTSPWNCPCGETGLTGNFCPECGRKRGD